MMVTSLEVAGLEVLVARMTRALVARGHQVGITCVEEEGPLGRQLREEGFRVEVVPAPGLRTILFPTELTRWLRSVAPDVLHIHSGAWLKGARAATAAGVPRVVHTVHGLLSDEPRYGPALKRWASRHTDSVAAVSEPLLRYLRDEVGLPAEKLRVVTNGVDAGTFRPGSPTGVVRRRFGLAPDRVVIGHVARFDPVKNHGQLVEAFAAARARFPAAFLALVGDGAERPAIERRVTELGLRDHVGFFGMARDLPDLYRDLDLFVLPSHMEGTSMSILEAMASGLCVVATRVGGNPALLEGGAGVLVDAGHVASLAAGLERVLGDASLRARLGRSARQRAETRFSESAMLDVYEEIYRSRARARPRRAGTFVRAGAQRSA